MDVNDFWNWFKTLSIRLTQPHKRSRIIRYLFPFSLIILLVVLDTLFGELRQQTPLLLLTFIIILSAWFGGFGPGMLATILTGVVSNYLFIEPRFSFTGIDGSIATIIFILQGITISLISEAKRQTDKQKDDFIGFASHELKNPLAAIQGNAQILQRTINNLKKKQVMDIANSINDQAKRATYLINELLDITKIESGKLTFHKEKFYLFDLLDSIVKEQKLIYITHKIILKGKTRKKVFCDKYRISQVIVNLITNAIKYSPNANKIVVSIKNNRREVVVSVQDFGKGITKDNVKKVFEAYFREGAVSHGTIQGLGLGLYISQEIAKKHNGRLWVESTEGKGSTFYLSLPYSSS